MTNTAEPWEYPTRRDIAFYVAAAVISVSVLAFAIIDPRPHVTVERDIVAVTADGRREWSGDVDLTFTQDGTPAVILPTEDGGKRVVMLPGAEVSVREIHI